MERIEEYFKKVEGRKRVPAKVKAIAVVLYFNGMSFRKVSEVLKHVCYGSRSKS